MIKVIVINGAGTSGKDTFIDLFTEVCSEQGDYEVFRYSSVDRVKHFALMMGWDGNKDDKGRRFLSDIKDAMTRYDDDPFEYMQMRVKDIQNNSKSGNAFIFFHVREPIEIEKMVERLGATTLLIERPSVDKDSFTNHADKDVRDFSYDYIVYNKGTLTDFADSAKVFYNLLIGGIL